MKSCKFGLALWMILMSGPGLIWAAWLKEVPVIFQQPDGTELACYVSGDEFFNWAHDRAGYPITRDPASGFYVYADVVDGVPHPTAHRAGVADPVRAGIRADFIIAPQTWEAKRQHFLAKPLQSYPPQRLAAPKTGALQNIVIFIRFSDESEFNDPISIYETSFNSATPGVNSLKNYFREVTYEQLEVHSYFYPIPASSVASFQDSHPRGYFMPVALHPLGYANEVERSEREQTLIRDAIAGVRGQIPADLNPDGDNDGQVDNVIFIISGTPTAWNTLLWPHAWSLFMHTVSINGKRVVSYNFQLQAFLSNGSTHVLVHEMLHNIGFPDLYHYSSDGLSPVGAWDVMASPLSPPQHPGAYTKWRYGGWISAIPEISGNGNYALNPLTAASGNCFKILTPEDTGGQQYYVVEYRRKQPGTFDASLPGEGMLVYRIDRRDSWNQGSTVIPEEVYIYRPGGTLSLNGSLAAATFSQESGRSVINNGGDPVPWLADDGRPGGLNLFNIGAAAEVLTFTLGMTVPPPPVLAAPANHTADTPPYAMLSWQASAGAERYDLQVAADPAFTVLLQDQVGISLTFWPVNSLARHRTYYWRIRARNFQGDGAWSAPFQFTTMPEAPGAVQLASPAEGATDVSLRPVLTWQSEPSSATYHLQISRQADFGVLVQDAIDVSGTHYAVSALDPGVTWFWRIAGHNAAGDGPWSDVCSFTTLTSPAAAPVLAMPSDGAAGEAVNPTLCWSPADDAAVYEVEVDSDAAFPAPLFQSADITATSVTVNNLENLVTYYWHVRARNEAGGGPWSVVRAFTTQELPVELLSFTATATAQGIHLEWVTASETENYGFDIERKAAATDLEMSAWQKIHFMEGHHSTAVRHVYEYLDRDIVPGDYAYRLKQIDLDGRFAYLPEQQVAWTQPALFKLNQNYPNPFNASTVITFELQAAGAVQLVILNAMGQTVRTLVDEGRPAGAHAARWDGCDAHGIPVAGGVYYCMLRCGAFQERKAMTLLK